jgi:serine/threonine-protein kinase
MKSDPPREVAIKTIRDASDPASLELFRRECSVLMSFTHPNVIEIYDTGDSDDRGNSKPFFVMARLRGVTLAELIKDSPQHLTVQRTIDIIYQVCRGLQAAHEKGLVHRDIKPSNIFVLEDDSVKVIDFGVAHLVSTETIGAKGTLYYMAPEQFEGKPVTSATDVFSLGVVCFEALTRRRPFGGSRPDEIRDEILNTTPPPVSSLNPAVSAALSQVIHAAMAKKALNRFSSAREFGECLKKALRNEPIDRFDSARLQLRLTRVEKALEGSQFDIGDEILSEIEEEGYLHQTVSELRRQVDQALRNRDIRQFLESARRFEAQEEYTLALQKVQDALQLEASNAEALELRGVIQAKRSSQQIGNWLNLAQRHLANCAFEPAREAVSSVLDILPTDVTALRLMTEINRVEQEVVRKREEKERFFDSAVELRKKGDLTAALSRLQRVLELDREAPDPVQPERGASFQKFYNEVRSESEAIRNALDEAKKLLESKDYAQADAICDSFLEKYSKHALFQALKFDIGERQRQDLSAFIAEVDREGDAEPDLDRKAKLLEQALARYPEEAHFKRALIGVNAKRDLINGLVGQARNLEDRGQYSEAIDKWEMLRTIYLQYPGLDFEVDRVRRRLEQHTRSEAKARWIERIDGALSSGDYSRALNLVQQALVESPQDAQLVPLERMARQRVEQSQRAQSLIEEAQKHLEDKSFDEALQILESAYSLDEHNALIRAVYIEAYLLKASAVVDVDLDGAEKLIESAYALDATNPRVRSLGVLVADRKRSAAIEQYLSNAREFQATNELERALAEVDKGLAVYPDEARLRQLKSSLEGSLKHSDLRKDRGKILDIRKRLEVSQDDSLMASLFEQSVVLAKKHPGDEQIQTIASEIGNEVTRRHNAATIAVPPAAPSDNSAPPLALPVENTEPVETPSRKIPIHERILIPQGLRVPILVGAAAMILILTAVAARSWRTTNDTTPPPLQPPAQLEQIKTADHAFNVSRAIDVIEKSIDPADLKSRLESLSLDERESDETFLRVARAYARLAELSFPDNAAAGAEIEKAKDYFHRLQAPSANVAQEFQTTITSLEGKLNNKPKPPAPVDPREVVSRQLASAKAAFDKGAAFETASDLDNALKQYSLAKGICDQILNSDASNASAIALRDNAKQAGIRIALKR